ncbi:MAG: chemotaxis protein CheW [Thalassolituus sp.]
MTPYALLKEMESRSRRFAAPLPQQIQTVATWRGIGYLLGGEQYVANMADVVEILQMPKVTRVPGVKSWVLGIANVRGRMVSVMDLNGLFGQPSRSNWRSQRVLVVEQDDYLIGLLVDAVLGMQSFPVDREAPAQRVPDALTPYVSRAYERDGRVWPVMEFGELMQSPDFLNIAV